MAEKVIFEFRARREGDDCVYEIRHPEEGITVQIPAVKRSAGKTIPHPFFHGLPCMMVPKRTSRTRKKSRKRMRDTLDFYERIYDELYGGEEPLNNRDEGNLGE